MAINKKLTISLTVFVALATAVATTFYLVQKSKTEAPKTPDTSEKTEKSEKSEKSEESEETATAPETPAETETPIEANPKPTTQSEGADPNLSATLTGVLTRADVANGNLVLRVNIDQYLTSGTCELTLKNGANIYSETANISDSASTSTCEGFDIPISKLVSGSWDITIKLNSGDKTGEISGKAVVK